MSWLGTLSAAIDDLARPLSDAKASSLSGTAWRWPGARTMGAAVLLMLKSIAKAEQ
jgi:hypothetical protein